MKCPLLTIGTVNPAGLRKGKWNDCLKEECAWWLDDYKGCAVQCLGGYLMRLTGVIEKIEVKMPHANQFTK